MALALAASACSSDRESDGGRPAGDTGPATIVSDAGALHVDGGRARDFAADARANRPAVNMDAGPLADATFAHDTGDGALRDAGQDGSAPCDVSVAPGVGRLALSPVDGVTGFKDLVFAAQPPGSTDWYLVAQSGTVHVLKDGALRIAPFLDLTAQIGAELAALEGDERGLLSLVFAPDYEASGKFYVMLTPTVGASANRDTVVEYRRSAGDPYLADPASAKTVLQLGVSEVNHNGGHLVFGPDGMLYVGTGDGGGACNSDQPGAPQDLKSLFGKLLRLDPKGMEPYAAAGNPFTLDGDPRVLHYGLRNPFRFSFDRLTGDLYIGDVGQDAYEEIDFAARDAKGLNFGWVAFEAKHAGGSDCGDGALRAGAMHTPPIFEADRRMGQSGPFADWISVIGGYVYRGSALPALRGIYLFGDYTGDRMGALVQCGNATSPVTPILKRRDPNLPNVAALARVNGAPELRQLTAIVQAGDGELYFVSNRDSLLKLVPAP